MSSASIIALASFTAACIERVSPKGKAELSAAKDDRKSESTPWVELVASTPKEARLAMFPLAPDLITRGKALLTSPTSNEKAAFASVIEPILREARRDLGRAPRSILNKKELPGWNELAESIPGLGARDYVSFARYAWPNPSKTGGIPYTTID